MHTPHEDCCLTSGSMSFRRSKKRENRRTKRQAEPVAGSRAGSREESVGCFEYLNFRWVGVRAD